MNSNLRARWYDPEVGRFLTKDPFGGISEFPQSIHAYVYALNNPINFTDPAGEFSIKRAFKKAIRVAKIVEPFVFPLTQPVSQAEQLYNKRKEGAPALVSFAVSTGVTKGLEATPLAPVARPIGGFAGGVSGYLVDSAIKGRRVRVEGILVAGVAGAATSGFPGPEWPFHGTLTEAQISGVIARVVIGATTASPGEAPPLLRNIESIVQGQTVAPSGGK